MRISLRFGAWITLALLGTHGRALAQDYRTPTSQVFPAALTSSARNLYQEAIGNGGEKKKNGNGNGNGNGDEKEGPKHIRDNAILVEEAFNQEAGEVQHIFVWNFLWNRTAADRKRDFIWNYTIELPLGSQKHQFSLTTNFISLYERPAGGAPDHQGGLSDTFLNYRYQLLDDDEFLWCAPRFTVILPTGDRRFGLGTGEVGYQFNLPVSRYGEKFDFHFNAGYTYIPNVSARLDNGLFTTGRDLSGYNLGASVYWKPKVDLHFYAEALALGVNALDDLGQRDHLNLVFLSPGFRWAVVQDPVEWVLGLAIPVGLTRDTPDVGIFVYMSIEHSFRKKNGD